LKSGPSERTAEDVAYITYSAELVVLLSSLRVTKDSIGLIYRLEFLICPVFLAGIISSFEAFLGTPKIP